LSVNLFGMDGPGFRRYFMLPVPGAQVLQTAALVSLIPGVTVVTLGIVAWLMFSLTPIDSRMIAVLIATGIGGLLLFHALGLWTTLLAPRAIPFGPALGNKLSPAANLLMIVSWILLFGPMIGLRQVDESRVLSAWWVAPVFLAVGAGAYLTTIRVGARLFVSRRERMIECLEEHR
jgi:hypothetical protein